MKKIQGFSMPLGMLGNADIQLASANLANAT